LVAQQRWLEVGSGDTYLPTFSWASTATGKKSARSSRASAAAMSGDFGWITDEASPLTVGGQAPTGWRSSCVLYVPELQNDADFGPFMRIDTMPDLPV
jgi:hypothetical protein